MARTMRVGVFKLNNDNVAELATVQYAVSAGVSSRTPILGEFRGDVNAPDTPWVNVALQVALPNHKGSVKRERTPTLIAPTPIDPNLGASSATNIYRLQNRLVRKPPL